MTQHAADIYGTAMKNGTATFMARVVDQEGAPLARGDVAAVAYSVFLLDDGDPDARHVVTGHDGVALAAAEVIGDGLRTSLPWDAAADPAGYNFRHTLDVSVKPAFPLAGRNYLIEYRLTPAAGQVVLVRFRIHVI